MEGKKKHKNLTPCLIFFYIYAEIEYRQKHKNIRKRFSGDTAFINRCQFSMFLKKLSFAKMHFWLKICMKNV